MRLKRAFSSISHMAVDEYMHRTTNNMPVEEWPSYGDEDYDPTGLGDDDIDGYDEE